MWSFLLSSLVLSFWLGEGEVTSASSGGEKETLAQNLTLTLNLREYSIMHGEAIACEGPHLRFSFRYSFKTGCLFLCYHVGLFPTQPSLWLFSDYHLISFHSYSRGCLLFGFEARTALCMCFTRESHQFFNLSCLVVYEKKHTIILFGFIKIWCD